MNLRRCEIFACVFGLLLAVATPLLAQFERPVERAVEHAVGKGEKSAADSAERAAEKLREDSDAQRKYYERYSTNDREYFGWFSSAELKKPFNHLVDDAIVSIRATNGAKVFKSAGNQQVVEALSSQAEALPPPERLTLKLNEHWLMPDTIDVSKAGSSETASVRVGSLRDYISEAIDKQHYPPRDPTALYLHGARLSTGEEPRVAPNQPNVAPAH